MRTTHPPLHSCCSISNPKGSRRESWAFEATSGGAPAGITASPEHPTGLSLLSLLPSAWETQGFITGSTTVTPVSRAISVLPGGGGTLSSPCQVPLLCFYILN